MKKIGKASCAVALGLAVAMAGHEALAQEAAAAPAAVPEQQLERIEITGSLIKRVETETALPVQVVSKEEIQKTGAATVEELMLVLPVMGSASNTTTAQNAGATTGGLSAISLHGLSSQRTLVLLNGRRMAPYGLPTDSVSVDINSIPIAAIERIEVLTEGASSLYGSDAIAGVVNFILKKDYQGAEASASYGDSTRGGGEKMNANLIYGYGDLAKDRFNGMFTASFERQSELWGRNRDFAKQGYGANFDSTSSNTFPGRITIPGIGAVNPGYPNCAPSVADPNFYTGSNYSPCRFDPASYVPLLPQSEHDSLFGSLQFALTDKLTAYSEISYNRNKQSQLEQPSPVSDIFTLAPGNPLFNQYPYNDALYSGATTPGSTASSRILLGPSSPFYPTSYVTGAYTANGLPVPGTLPTLDVRYRTFYNGGRGLDDTSETPRIVLGLKGSAVGWDFDANVVHTTNEIRENTTSGYFIQSQLLPLLNSGNINLLYPALGPAPTASQIAAMQATNYNGTAWVDKMTLDDVQGHASRDIANLQGGALTAAVGAEFRREKWETDPTANLWTGDISGYGGNFLPAGAQRNMYAVFGELDAPLLKSLETDFSVRFDHYQEIGSRTSPKIGAKWQPTEMFLLRGSASKGFRAPGLSDMFAPITQSVTPTLTDPLDCVGTTGNGCNFQPTTKLGGNPNLKPETSTNLTYGLVFQPLKTLSASIDFYDITVKNLIALGGLNPVFIFSNLNTWGSLVTRSTTPDPSFTSGPAHYQAILVDQTNINIGAMRTRGFDFDLHWVIPEVSSGKVTADVSGTYVAKFMLQNPDGSYTDEVDTANQTLSLGGVVPRMRYRATLDYASHGWDVMVAQNWQGSYQDIYPGMTVGTYETYDLNVNYTGFKKWTINLGIQNIFDRDPPFTAAGGLNWFQSGYDPSYASPLGRFLYLTVGYKFK
jgi:iron complex outermembrane receptor protein